MRQRLWLRPSSSIVICLGALSLFYNNCTFRKIDFISNQSLQMSSDNGYGYGGKLTYNRYLPDFGCETKASPLSTIEISPDEIFLTERNPYQCATPKTSLTQNNLDISPLQNDVIGHQTGMYMNVDPNTTGIPDKLAEAWCRDEQNPNLDVITSYNRIEQKGFAKIYYRDPQQLGSIQTLGEFPASRLISQHLVQYGAHQFELRIDRDDLAPSPGTFWGQLRFSDQGQNFQRKVFCRLGGDLDPKIWPMTQINDFSNGYGIQSLYDKTTESIVYRAYLEETHGFALFSWKNKKANMLISSNHFGGEIGVFNFQLSEMGQVIFESDTSQRPFSMRLFSLDLISKNISRLSGVGNSFSHGSGNYSYDRKNDVVFFLDDSARTMVTTENDLYISDLLGNRRQINQALPDSVGILGSKVISYSLGQVSPILAYTYSVTSEKTSGLGVANFDGSQRRLIDLSQLGLSDIPFGKINFAGNDQLLVFADQPTMGDKTTYAFSLRDNLLRKVRTQEVNAGGDIIISKPTGKFLLYTYSPQTVPLLSEYFVRDTATWVEISLGPLDAQAVLSLRIDESHQQARMLVNNEVVEINLTSGQRASPCPNTNGMTTLDIFTSNNASFGDLVSYLAKVSAQGDHHQLFLFELKNGQCKLKNSTLLGSVATLKLTDLAPNQTGVLVIAQPIERNYFSVIHVPLDGKPPIQLSTPAFLGAMVYSALYIDGGRSVVFEGNQTNQTFYDLYYLPLSR